MKFAPTSCQAGITWVKITSLRVML